jgi:macrolide transport system ATP-binding/permease protein
MDQMPFRRRGRRPTDAEIARELNDHLELDAHEMEKHGTPANDARLTARRRFGNVASLQELTRESWGGLWLERLQQDLQFGLRMLRRTPVFTAVAVICLGLGIGANAVVLSWTEGIIRHPFPAVRDQDQLVAVAGTAKGESGFNEMSWPDFLDLGKGTTAFSAFFVSKITGATLSGGDRAERLVGQLTTANFFDAIGVRPILGRGFAPGEDVGRDAHPVTVISYRLWRDHFAGDPAIVGKTINYNGVPHSIIGVTPEAFLGTFVGYAMQFWVPAVQQTVFDPSGYKLEDRTARWVEGFARLKPGVSLAAGQAQIDGAARRLELEFPNDDRGRGVRILPLTSNPFDVSQELKPMLRVSSIVAILVLLIVCANIANLLLVRAIARRGEITVRQALGASRGRVTRQLVTEGLILAVLGTAAGLAFAYASRNVLGLFFPPRSGATLVFAADFNWRVLSLTVAVGLGSTVVFALVPALQMTNVDFAKAIRAATPGAISGGSRASLRSALVLVQVGLGEVLLVGAGLMVLSLSRLLNANPGFAATNVTTTAVNLFAAGYDTARAHRFEDDLLDRSRAIAGVSSSALARNLPFATRPYDNGPIQVDDFQPAKDEQPTADYNAVSPGYFKTFEIPVTSGRDFTTADADTSVPVAIVTHAMAERYWPNASPIGKNLQLRGKRLTIVGVVSDIKYRSLMQSPGMLFYVPLAQMRSTSVAAFLRTSSTNPRGLALAIVGAIHAIDPSVAPYEIITMREQMNRSTSGQQITVSLLSIFSGVALFLAAIGLYGTISYMVSQSTRELGVRLALGATPTQVLTLVMSSGLRLTLVGIALGVTTALGTTRLLGDLLFRVSPRDPIVIGGVAAVMAAVSMIACLVPAWRASSIDPMRALRS